MRHIGDIADKAGRELQEEHERIVSERPVPFDEDPKIMEKKGVGVFGKLKFEWRDSDRMILDQIRAAAQRAFIEGFGDSLRVLDRLYEAVRVPEANEHGVVKVDQDGRPVWQTDSDGRYLEDWDNLTGQDIERCLFDLSRIRLYVGPQVNELLMEAMFAKRIHRDIHDDAYLGPVQGTVADRTAQANRKSRQDDYQAFYRYMLWSQGDTFLKELGNMQRTLERFREWGIRGQQGYGNRR
ncbi:hypothetical protein SEA_REDWATTLEHOG_84 [Gordonia phage RedWattleHog]|uniref:Uncharacterized protein n=1 Tax=Gordonia phage Stormageddon TaxID=2656541 RepID=A0A649VRX3_9CAUD|nr:hypothetical protein KHQ86_gp081 [Gordonia phage Stormageddon]QGJ94944.1 hypothetical protein SEA_STORMAGEDDON_81 [Gordonia phage Stormageddon]QLF83588.1 hypothetical protein SEA_REDWATTLEHOG_84 [Gordonia phage RedWattleHog]